MIYVDSAYASIIGIYTSVHDFKIQFRDITPVVDDNGKIVGQSTTYEQFITMTPSVAKELYILLGEQINSYEGQFGSITTFLPKQESQTDE